MDIRFMIIPLSTNLPFVMTCCVHLSVVCGLHHTYSGALLAVASATPAENFPTPEIHAKMVKHPGPVVFE